MSKTTFNVNNIKYFSSSDKNIILVGDIVVETTPPYSIVVSSTINEPVHLVVDKFQLDEFRRLASLAPVTKHSVYLYDQQGNVVSKYEADRTSNASGNVSITKPPEVLIGNITLPKVTNGSVYFCLFNYPALNMISSKEHKNELIEKDIAKFLKNNDLTNVNLLITENIAQELIDSMKTLSFFKTVKIIKQKEIDYVSECVFGKIISGDKPCFQGFLNFPNFEIVHSKTKGYDGIDTINFTNRRNGRIQVNTSGLNSKISFMILLQRKNSSYIPSFYEEVTGNKFELDQTMWVNPYETSKTFNLTDEYIYNYVDAINFLITLNNTDKSELKTLFQETYPMIVLKYLFHPIENVCKSELLQNNSMIIYNDFCRVMTDIRRIIKNQFAENQIGIKPPMGATVCYNFDPFASPPTTLARSITGISSAINDV